MSVFAYGIARAAAARGYDGAKIGRTTSDWVASATSSDAEIRANYRRLIDRSRDLERNNDYWRGFLLALEKNVVGAIRSDLRMDCGELGRGSAGKPPPWIADWGANTQIENAWKAWGKKGVCTVCGRYSWRDVKNLLVRSLARDGNFIARKIWGKAARNRFGFALQIWEIDHLDLQLFGTLKNGNAIRFGIEFDPAGRVVAYYLRARHPGDGYFSAASSETVRVDASEINHLFVRERAEQSIGVPWCVSAITRLRQLGAFEEAAVIAARIGAGKMGFLTKKAGPNGEVGSWTGETNAKGNGVIDGQPGTFEELPLGWDLATWSAEYPNIETGDFRKAMLRGIATSLGQSYTTLGNDLEAVSFASSRVGLFEEREGWKSIQLFVTEGFYEATFEDFLTAAISSKEVNLPMDKFAKFNRPTFKSRRWALVDPLKELLALKLAIALRVTSRRAFVEEQGGDIEDVFADTKADEDLAANSEISLTPPDPQPTTSVSLASDPEADPMITDAPPPPPGQKKSAGQDRGALVSEIVGRIAEMFGARQAPAPAITIKNAPP